MVIGKKRFYFFFEQCTSKDKIEFSTFTALNGDIIRKIPVKVFLLLSTQSQIDITDDQLGGKEPTKDNLQPEICMEATLGSKIEQV